jgi:hypothetical protein
LFSNGTTIAQNNANLFWDNTNNRLGIGTASPIAPLVVQSNSGALGISIRQRTGNDFANLLFTNLSDTTLGGVGYVATSRMRFMAGGLGDAFERLSVFQSTGNVAINTTTDAGYKLDVNGTARVQNHIFLASGFSYISLGNNVNLRSNIAGGSGYIIDVQSYNTLNSSSNEQGFANFLGTYAPTSVSGTPAFNALKVTPTINQTGGANQITRGLFINPTLTAVADFRAIEVASGITILGAATTAKASLRIPSGTAPTSPVDGDIWFDGTNIKMRIGGVTKTFTLI